MQLVVDGDTAITLSSAAAKSANKMHTFGHGIHSFMQSDVLHSRANGQLYGGRLKMHI